MAQINVLIMAGYETTSISLTWALVELSRHPEKQERLREELFAFTASDPTWEQLSTGLPYLDSVVHEVLRMHPPVGIINRVATENDIIPFNSPVTNLSGGKVSSLVIKKGTTITVSIRAMNRSVAFWGKNAKEFMPERWLGDGIDSGANIRARAIQGHRHLLTFVDGPRICLGRGFALAEFKAALSVLVHNYSFELPDGVNTKVETHQGLSPRPKVFGQIGAKVPLRIRKIE